MSLINDALKRASETQPPPLPASEPTPPMQAAEHKRPSTWPLVVVPLLLVLVLVVAGWFLLKGAAANRQIKAFGGPETAAARENAAEDGTPSSTSTTPEVLPPPRAFPEQAPANKKPKSPQFTASPEKPVTPVDFGKAEGSFPALKLQGIFYRTTNPSAVINSKTLFVGDRIEHARVTAIERDSATLEWNGETRVLTLE